MKKIGLNQEQKTEMIQNGTENHIKLLPTTSITDNTSQTSCFWSYRGILLALFSELFLALSNVFFKKAHLLNAMELGFIRYCLQGISMFAIIRYKKLQVFGEKTQRIILVYRGILGATCMLFTISSLKFIDPSDTIALVNLNVIIVAILSCFFLKNEKLNPLHYVSIFFTIMGIILFLHLPKS
jgi:drug/metabolite transporter (DMT)-like permease